METNPKNLQGAIKYAVQPSSLSAMQGYYPVQQHKGTLYLSTAIVAKFNLMGFVPMDPLGLLVPLLLVPTMIRLQPRAN